MTAWKITAKTIYCEAVDDEVTLLLHSDGTMRCTGFRKYNEPNSLTRSAMREKIRRFNKRIKCEGENCPRVTQYKEKILAEENT